MPRRDDSVVTRSDAPAAPGEPPAPRRLPVLGSAQARSTVEPSGTGSVAPNDAGLRARRIRRFTTSVAQRLLRASAPYTDSVPTALGERRLAALTGIARAALDAVDPAGTRWRIGALDTTPSRITLLDAVSGHEVVFAFERSRPKGGLQLGSGLWGRYELRGPTQPDDARVVEALAGAAARWADASDGRESAGRLLTAPDATRIAVYPRDGRVELRPTLACNHHCPFCNSVDRTIENAMHGAADLRATRGAWAHLPILRAVISGGEPTLLKDLGTLVRDLADDGLVVELQTNGMAFADRDYAASLRAAGLHTALVSLHADDATLSDTRITRLAGAWERTVRGIDTALDLGISVELSHVLHAANALRFPSFVRFVAGRWGRRVRIRLAFVAPTGAAEEAGESVMPPLQDTLPSLRAGLAAADDLGVRVKIVGYCGVPPCLLAPYEHVSESAYRGRTQTAEDHVKFPACASCVYDRGCPGLWKQYVDTHGDPGIRAVTRAPWRVRVLRPLTTRLL